MALISGEVRTQQVKSSGILVEVFSVANDFQTRLPVKDRKALSDLAPTRLGSALTDNSGRFEISYAHPLESPTKATTSPTTLNIWLAASTIGKDKKLTLVHQETDVRRNAGITETFTVLLDDDVLPIFSPFIPIATAPTPERIKANIQAHKVAADTLMIIEREKQKNRATLRKNFHDNIGPSLRKELSILPDPDQPNDPDYVKPGISIWNHTSTRIHKAVTTSFVANADEPITLTCRVSLTDEQFSAVEQAGQVENDTIIVSEEAVTNILKDKGTGLNPEIGQNSITRVDALKEFCRQQTKGKDCLNSDDPVEPEEPNIATPQPSDTTDQVGDNITKEELEQKINNYIARILDDTEEEQGGSQSLPGTGTQLNQQDLTGSANFPAFTLPPGPADVPAYYDFSNLQIAFKPVWMEALDDGLLDEAADAYEQFVERGGDTSTVTPNINSNTNWKKFIQNINLTLSPKQNTPTAIVIRYINVTLEEWHALPTSYKDALQMIAGEIDDLYGRYKGPKMSDSQGTVVHDYTVGAIPNSLIHFNNTHSYLETQVADWRNQAERIIGYARHEVEQNPSKSPIPTHRIITSMQARALSRYAATYFAADRKERSVNFGLLTTYRQRWEPTVYQVGELIKSIPLAPKEVRKYSKKIVLKEKRSRKEMESNVSSQRRETNSTSRSEAEIVSRAAAKTNFNATTEGTFNIGIAEGKATTSFGQDASNDSAETKKSFHEAVVKAASELKNEFKVELETESTSESEYVESGELINPNDELCVTYLFYELQRRYRVTERLHRLTSVVLVAQEMPAPAEIDEDWLIAHRWILNRVPLEDRFKQPLVYVATAMVAEEHRLKEMRKSLAQLRHLVDALQEDITESRSLTQSRYAALQRSIERSAQAAQNKDNVGFFDLAKDFTGVGAVADLAERMFSKKGENPEAARIREEATRDAYEREIQRLQDLEGRLATSNSSLARATQEYTDAMSTHLSNVVLVYELRNHVKDNIIYYMQAIWLHEPEDRRWLRLKDTLVPVFERGNRSLVINRNPVKASLANIAHLNTKTYEFTVKAGLNALPEDEPLPTVPLYQVADLDRPLGFKANYMIFPMKQANAITDFMMEPYVERAAGAYGLIDPDELGNVTLDEFSDYVCCLKKALPAEEFALLREPLKEQLQKLLTSPLRDNEEIVVPLDAMYIEAFPSSKPLLENFKLLHRKIDAMDAEQNVKLKKLEKARYAKRLLEGKLDDPEVKARYVFEGGGSATVVPPANT